MRPLIFTIVFALSACTDGGTTGSTPEFIGSVPLKGDLIYKFK